MKAARGEEHAAGAGATPTNGAMTEEVLLLCDEDEEVAAVVEAVTAATEVAAAGVKVFLTLSISWRTPGRSSSTSDTDGMKLVSKWSATAADTWASFELDFFSTAAAAYASFLSLAHLALFSVGLGGRSSVTVLPLVNASSVFDLASHAASTWLGMVASSLVTRCACRSVVVTAAAVGVDEDEGEDDESGGGGDGDEEEDEVGTSAVTGSTLDSSF